MNRIVLEGTTYPHLPFVPDIEVIMDVGANCGSASTWFSRLYPSARIFAFEPAAEPFRLLQGNTLALDNVTVFNIGLNDADDRVELYHSDIETMMASIHPNLHTSDSSETIEIRSARGWFDQSGLDRLDVLKIDTEGCEVAILESLRGLLDRVKIIYLEFHNEPDRKVIDAMLGETHSLFVGRMIEDEGEVVYLSRRHVPEKGTADLTHILAAGR
jgi:FkbM family methyltransferase